MTTFFEEKSVVFFFFNGNMVHHKIVIPFQVTIAKVLIIVSYLNYQISVWKYFSLCMKVITE